MAKAITLIVVVSVLCQLAAASGSPFEKINEYLLENVKTEGPNANVDACNNMLAQTSAIHMSLVSALKDIIALPEAVNRCDADSYEIMRRNAERSTFMKLDRVNDVVLHFRQQHALHCEQQLRDEIRAARQAVASEDPHAVARVELLAETVGEQLHREVKGYHTIPLMLALEKKHFGKSDSDAYYTYLSLAESAHQDPEYNTVFARDGSARLDNVRGLVERTLIHPCELYAANLDAVADRANIDGSAMFSINQDQFGVYHRVAAAHHLCKSVLKHKSELIKGVYNNVQEKQQS